MTPARALAGEQDPATRAFLEGLAEDTLVFDLRGVPTPVELIGDNKLRTYVRHGEIVARVLDPSERRVRPETGWPEATWHIDLTLGYVKDGLFDQAKGALEKAAELDPEHPRLSEARSALASALSALGGVDPLAIVKEVRRRFEQGEHVEGLEAPAVVTGMSSTYLQTKHPTLGDIAIFRPTLHTPLHEGDRVRLVGILSVGRDLLRATDYIVVA